MDNKKRILVLCASFPPRGKGGGPFSSYLFSKALKDAGFEIMVVTVGDENGVEDYEGIEVHIVKSPNIYWDYLNKTYSPLKKIIWHVLENFNPVAYFRFKPIIEQFKPNVVVTISIENINVSTWLLAKSLKIPVVHLTYSYFLFCSKGGFFKNCSNCQKQCLDCKVLSIGKKYFSKNVDVVIGETDFVMQEHVKQNVFKNIQLVKIPSPVLPFPLNEPKRKNGDLVVGYMGVIEQHKGVEILAEAAAAIGANTGVKFMIAGTSRNIDYLETLKSKFANANVTFMGWVKPEEAYPQFDVLVVPSLWKEPFGRIVAEALSYGIPVISAKSGGIAENIVHGENGYLYEPNNYQELAGLINKLSANENLRFNMAQKAKTSAIEFSYPLFVDRLSSFFNTFLNERS